MQDNAFLDSADGLGLCWNRCLYELRTQPAKEMIGTMARDLPVGNGNVLVNHGLHGNIRCIYYPHVGQENHALDHMSRFGVSVDGSFFWLDDPEVERQARYLPNALIAELVCRHPRHGVIVTLHDLVDQHDNVFLRRVSVQDTSGAERREVRLFFHLDINLYGSQIANTILYHPETQGLVCYKEHRYISLSGLCEDAPAAPPAGFACGQKGIHGLQGTWKDAEDGRLEGHPISQGSVDGVLQLNLALRAQEPAVGWFWMCFGMGLEEILALEKALRAAGPEAYRSRTEAYWQRWIARDRHEVGLLPEDIAQHYRNSLMIARTNMDHAGAIIAANDSTMLEDAQDTYSYMWPRDGALVAHALDRAGFHDFTRRFFDFCKHVITPGGYLMHKYNPDESVGASWLPWVDERGEPQLPIQEDETALVVYALWNHHETAGTLDESLDDYEKFVLPAADFLVRFRDANGLPTPSYDLWEERFGVFSFTVASVYAGLATAARFAGYHGDAKRQAEYEQAAREVRQAAEVHLYNQEEQRFVRAVYPVRGSDPPRYEQDMEPDSSVYGVFDFGLVDAGDERVVNTMRHLRETLWVKTDIGGMARYRRDQYYRVAQDEETAPGNPWFICTLWYAEWLIERAASREEMREPEELLRWAIRRALPSGVMAEQIDPFTGSPLSVSPLTWSHATYIKVTQEYLAKWQSLDNA